MLSRKQTLETINQKEGFCLMFYAPKRSGAEPIWVWNSRDGVTPFVIRINGEDYYHENWWDDTVCPNFIPPDGMPFFVDFVPTEPDFEIWYANMARANRDLPLPDKEVMRQSYFNTRPGEPTMVISSPETRQRYLSNRPQYIPNPRRG